MLSTPLRRFVLTTHLTASLGWLGAVVAFLALSIAGVSSGDAQTVRAAYLMMELTTWYVIVPFCLAALLTGVVESAGTPWGFFRHYWVITKLGLTVVATILLLVHTRPIDQVAQAASMGSLTASDLRHLRLQLVGDASAALCVLLVTTVLSVYKPWGLTPYGIRAQAITGRSNRWSTVARRSAGRYLLIAAFMFVVVIVLLHLAGMGLRH